MRAASKDSLTSGMTMGYTNFHPASLHEKLLPAPIWLDALNNSLSWIFQI